jgi:hypothetical protein
LAHKDWHVQYRAAEFIFNYPDKVPSEVVARVCEKTLPDLLAHEDRFAQDQARILIDQHLDKVSPKDAAKFLRDWLAHKDWRVQYRATKIILNHSDKVQSEVVRKVYEATLPYLLAHEDRFVQVRAAEIIFNHSDKVPPEVVRKVYEETLLGWLTHKDWLVQASRLINRYFDKIPNLERFTSAIRPYFKDKKQAKNIVNIISKALLLPQLLKLSALLQYPSYCKAVLQKARRENMVIFYTEKNGEFYLHYGQQVFDKIPVNKNVIRNFRYAENEGESIDCESKLNDEEQFQQKVRIYQLAVYNELAHYPNRISYQKARQRVLEDEQNEISTSSAMTVIPVIESGNVNPPQQDVALSIAESSISPAHTVPGSANLALNRYGMHNSISPSVVPPDSSADENKSTCCIT